MPRPAALELLGAVPAAAGGGGGPAGLANVVGWWDASDAATITHSAGRVSQWNDKSGNARHLTQATAGLKPLTASRTQNGLNTIDFDAVTRSMTAAFTLAQPITFYYVVVIDAVPAYGRLFDGGTGGNRANLYRNGPGGNWTISATSAVDTTKVVSTGARSHVALFNGAASKFYENGTQYGGSMNTGAGGVVSPLSIGDVAAGSVAVDGGYCEIVCQAAAASAADVSAWGAYTLPKWGV